MRKSFLVVLSLLVVGCASLTPQQSSTLREAQRLANEVTSAYGVEQVRVIAGDYLDSWYSRQHGWIGVEARILTTDELNVILPFFLGRATLRHRDPPYERKHMEQDTLAANWRAIEIMVRFLGMSEREAVGRFGGYFIGINDRLLAHVEFAKEYGRLDPVLRVGHPHPCEQLKDLWSHFAISDPQPTCIQGPTWPGRFATGGSNVCRPQARLARPVVRREPTPRQQVIASRRICALCGIAFAIVIPPGDPETPRDRLCGLCAMLPAPPPGPDDAPAA
jgi:hypothetical protein